MDTFYTISKEFQMEGNSWVGDEAKVHGNAQVYGSAQVYGNSWVHGNAKVHGTTKISQSNITSVKDYINILLNPYPITVTKEEVSIGCQTKRYEEWMEIYRKKLEVFLKEQKIRSSFTIEMRNLYYNVIKTIYEGRFL